MEKRFLLTAALFSDALAATGPLRRRLESADGRPAAVAGRGRGLREGPEALRGRGGPGLGRLPGVRQTEIAARGPAARKEYVDALHGSTAIPVAFPPVGIGGRTYVDGGVRRNIFLELVVGELAQLRKLRIAPGAPGDGVLSRQTAR
jgi:hypothetical protein